MVSVDTDDLIYINGCVIIDDKIYKMIPNDYSDMV